MHLAASGFLGSHQPVRGISGLFHRPKGNKSCVASASEIEGGLPIALYRLAVCLVSLSTYVASSLESLTHASSSKGNTGSDTCRYDCNLHLEKKKHS